MATKRERGREGGGGTERNKGAMESAEKETRKAFACFGDIMVSQTEITHCIHLPAQARCASSLPGVPAPHSGLRFRAWELLCLGLISATLTEV